MLSGRGCRTAVALALTAALAASSVQSAHADDDDHPVPSRRDVRDARHAVDATRLDLRGVQDALDAANARLEDASIRAARAAEAFNGARYEARLARAEARRAADAALEAADDADRQRRAYRKAMLASYTHGSSVGALSSMVRADGLSELVERRATIRTSRDALDARYDDLRAAQDRAEEAADDAAAALDEAEDAQARAREARDAARAAEDRAASLAAEVTREKSDLIARLAELQGVSVRLATRRRAALEARRAEHAAEQVRDEVDPQPSPPPEAGDPEPTTPADDPSDTEEPPAAPPSPPPAPSGGAQQAIAFARAQLGEPYRWGAAGPGAWDCSGLTMASWGAAGKSLPHYSVAQYEQSTPIGAGDLRPGDLVFWGSSGSPSSIYHVALYVGDGRIVHAPRTGRPVSEESMYYWIPPTFYARP